MKSVLTLIFFFLQGTVFAGGLSQGEMNCWNAIAHFSEGDVIRFIHSRLAFIRDGRNSRLFYLYRPERSAWSFREVIDEENPAYFVEVSHYRWVQYIPVSPEFSVEREESVWISPQISPSFRFGYELAANRLYQSGWVNAIHHASDSTRQQVFGELRSSADEFLMEETSVVPTTSALPDIDQALFIRGFEAYLELVKSRRNSRNFERFFELAYQRFSWTEKLQDLVLVGPEHLEIHLIQRADGQLFMGSQPLQQRESMQEEVILMERLAAVGYDLQGKVRQSLAQEAHQFFRYSFSYRVWHEVTQVVTRQHASGMSYQDIRDELIQLFHEAEEALMACSNAYSISEQVQQKLLEMKVRAIPY